MKNMKKGISILLCLSLLGVMLLACAGCGSKESVVGDWAGDIDFTDEMTEVLEDSIGDETAMEYIKIGKVAMTLNLSLEKGGDYTMEIDKASAEKMVNDLIDSLKDGMRDYFEQLIADQDVNMSVDEFFQAMAGTSYDEYVDSMMSADMIMSQFEGMEDKGTYKVNKDELVLKSDDGSEQTFTFKLDGSTLTLDSDEDFGFEMFPLKMTKK